MDKILVVDDEVAITTHLEKRLNWMGYEVVGRASSGKESIKMAKRFKPDLILMDIVMPGELDGIEASKIIKKELDIPIVFLTAYADNKFINRAKNVQPFGYLVKPVNLDEIKATIEVALHKKETERRLCDLVEKYLALVNNINYAVISFDSHKKITFWNHGAETIFGYSADEAFGKSITFIFAKRFRKDYENEMNRMVLTGKSNIIGKVVEIYGLRKDGSKLPFEFSLAFWKMKGMMFFACIGCDITERKQKEEEVKKYQEHIEDLVEECTTNLKSANEQLQWEITERKKAEGALAVFESKLREQKSALEKKSMALMEIIAQIEIEKRRIKDYMDANIETLIFPILEKIKLRKFSPKIVNLLKYQLERLSSSFGSKITKKSLKLTPREIEVCNMVKSGLTSKDISSILNISCRTVEKHRKNIRHKLGITNKHINLTSFLREL